MVAVEPASADPIVNGDSRIKLGGGVVGHEAEVAPVVSASGDARLGQAICTPGPGVAKPECRQDVERCGVWASVVSRDPDGNILGIGLGILDVNVEVTVVIENARVDEFVFRSLPLTTLIFSDQIRIGKGPLRILVEQVHVGVAWRVVNVEVVVFQIFAVVAFERVHTKEAFLQMAVDTIPECGRKTEKLIAITDASNAVLAPAIGFCASHVVREKGPRIPVGGVVFPDGAPAPVGEIGPPPAPSAEIIANLFNAQSLGIRLRVTMVVVSRHGWRKLTGRDGVLCGSAPSSFEPLNPTPRSTRSRITRCIRHSQINRFGLHRRAAGQTARYASAHPPTIKKWPPRLFYE